MKRKLLIISALALLFTPVNPLTMPNPAEQGPGKFQNFRQMMRYHEGLKYHGLKSKMTVVYISRDGDEMYFYRSGERCRI